MNVAGIVMRITGEEGEVRKRLRVIAELGLHSLESLFAGVGELGVPVRTDDRDDQVLEHHVEEGEIKGKLTVEPPGLDADLAASSSFGLEDLRALRFGQIGSGWLKRRLGSDVDVGLVQDS